MKKCKHLFFILAMLLICASLSIPLLHGAYFSRTDADYHYTILDSGMFTQDVNVGDSVHTLNCYRIKNYDTYVAVAWGESTNSAPQTMTIPNTITSNKPTGSNVDYTVVAVARAGFSHCTSKAITLPQTVKDIREEAFAYCQKLKTFIIPKDVNQISPSTFLDCRSLTNVYYSNDEGKRTIYNSKITSFGDHAFDSCVSLRKIQCQSTAVFFGQSCFQKCSTLSVFRFPVDNGENSENRNTITVEDYAFADCTSLQKVYFDINMLHVSDYAFADAKSDLTFYFYSSESNFPNTLSSLWRNKKITFGTEIVEGDTIDYSTTVYDINYNIEKPVEGNYPGLIVHTSNEERKLDNARTNTTDVIVIPGGGSQYAVIDRFEAPDDDYPDYYEDGVLTIPDEVIINKVRYPVKVIESNAFENNDDITEVHFNSQLAQICHRAFWHSNNIAILDFTDCEDLVEISYSIFNDIITKNGKEEDAINTDVNASLTQDDSNRNYALTSLTLPNCLQYLGNFAFYNFVRLTKGLSFKTNPNEPASLKLIGDYAFAVYSEGGNNGDNATNKYLGDIKAEMDVELPNSLDDSYAQSANIYHSFSWDRKGGSSITYSTVNKSIWNRVAINKNAFDNQDGLRSIKMEKGGTPHDISFGSNVFVRNTGIIRFEASEHLCLLGNETFKTCSNLREVFLTTSRSVNNNHGCNSSGTLENTDVSNPWGVGDGTNSYNQNIFHTDDFYDLVVYVNRNSQNDKYPNTDKTWYGAFLNGNERAYKTTEIGSGRRQSIPVYNVDWTVDGNVKYWHINDAYSDSDISAHDEILSFDNGPRTQDDYNNGYVSFVKTGGNYTVARYFTKGDSGNYAKTIDLTTSKFNGMTITTIGHEAFGGSGARGYYFVLPATITSIEERAFYRYNNGNGVRIVTFKKNSSSPIQTFNGSDKTFEQIVSNIEAQNNDNNRIGYCCLPNTITRIERGTFYNNFFGHVELGKALSYFTAGAFYSNVSKAKNQDFAFTDYDSTTSPDTNSVFEVYNNGIYHKTNKILLQQANGISGALTIKSGTKYIGYRAVAGSKYTSVAFDNATQRIYGYAFKNCTNLVSITNISNIISIGTDDGYPTLDSDYSKIDGEGSVHDSSAFEGCSKLKVDFSQMTALEKIGQSSFKGCTILVTGLSLSKEYSMNSYTPNSTPGEGTVIEIASNPDKVLDLSTLTGLTNIGANAFENVSISYVFMPNTTGTTYNTSSNLTCGGDMFKGTGAKVLCGETAQQADQGGEYWSSSRYPVNCMGSYTNLYYRFHSSDDILGETAGTTRRYWTAIKTNKANQVKVILFESKEQALDWLASTNNVNSQCHTFPEQVS